MCARAKLPERHTSAGQTPARCEPCTQRGEACRQQSLPRRWGVIVDYCPYLTTTRNEPELVSSDAPA